MRRTFRLFLACLPFLMPACKEKAVSRTASGGQPAADAPPAASSGTGTDRETDAAWAGGVGHASVWFDLRVPKTDGKVSGAYLYVKHGKDIPIAGERKGDSLILEESIGGKATGLFRLARLSGSPEAGDRWVGSWNKPGSRKRLDVDLYPVHPDFKACHLADPESLTTSDGVSLASEIASKTPSDETLEEQSRQSGDRVEPPDYAITGCAQGLMTARLTVYYYPGHGPVIENSPYLWTFDLARKTEIKLWDEIDSSRTEAFSKYLEGLLGPYLEELKPGTGEASGDARAADTARPGIPGLESARIKIEEGRIKLGFLDNFELSGLLAGEGEPGPRELWAAADPADLRRFLKKTSVLNAFAAATE